MATSNSRSVRCSSRRTSVRRSHRNSAIRKSGCAGSRPRADEVHMDTVISKDGTPIAYSRLGHGPALVLVDGALCYRASGPSGPLAQALAGHFTVFTYDRRGRGESGDTTPYSVEREIEDLEGVIAAAGGGACVYGVSSGAALALEAAHRGLPIAK